VVRLGNQSTALADVSIRPGNSSSPRPPELFQQYKTFDNVRVNLIERNLSVALNEVFAAFNPLDPQNLDVSPLPSLAKRAADIMRQDVGGQVDIFDVNVPTIQYDQGTEDKINQLNQQRAQTSIAVEAQKTAEAQAKANEILSRSISNDPMLLYRTVLRPRSTRGSARWVAGRAARLFPPSPSQGGNTCFAAPPDGNDIAHKKCSRHRISALIMVGVGIHHEGSQRDSYQ